MIVEEDKHASSQRWDHWRSQCPMLENSPRTNVEWRTTNIQKRPNLDAAYTFDLQIAEYRGLNIFFNWQLLQFSLLHHAIRW